MSHQRPAPTRYPQQPTDVSGAQYYQDPGQQQTTGQANNVNFYNTNAHGVVQSQQVND